MAKTSIRKNYFYNVSYQILLLVTPLITTPYLARVLGADGVGTASFAGSVVSYFTLFATFGMATFGQREVSYAQDDIQRRSRVFWETKCLELITSGIALCCYIPFALHQTNARLYLILALNLCSVIANVTWFFQGMEEFGKIVLRNFVCKGANIAFIFLFVRTKEDLLKYVFGLAFFTLVGDISLWAYLPRYIRLPQWKELKPFRHIPVIITLFVPTIAIQIYTVFDKTMIGLITGSAFENGYYEQALKVSKLVLTVVTALGTVMIPRIGYHFEKGDTEQVRTYMYRAYRFVWFLGVPLSFGLLGIAPVLVPWFFGPGYDKVVPLLGILGFLVPVIGISNVTGMQYLLPTKRQNLFTLTVVVGAGVNFILNLILIRFLASTGAAVASLAAETVISLFQLYLIRKELSRRVIFLGSRTYLAAGALMLILVLVLRSFLPATAPATGLLVITGAAVYFGMLFFMKDDFFLENSRAVFRRLKG